ncbi:hypothetical protein [Dactylosporangium sp. NPDC048998]|uniref:hypothetical protein n=1 Tax=Dactylosporangium sp. NPDC048998 TaxID=3363976 RepID=UPI0037217E31
MSRSLRSPALGAFRLAVVTALVAVGDAVVTVAGRYRFGTSLDAYGWVIGGPPYDGTLQRFVFCISVAVIVAAVGVAAAVFVTQPRPGSRLAVMYSLPACVVVDLFTVVYGPNNIGAESRGVSPAALAESEAAFDHIFPLWYLGGHAIGIGLLALLTARLLIVLRKPDVRDFYEYYNPDVPPVLRWGRGSNDR